MTDDTRNTEAVEETTPSTNVSAGGSSEPELVEKTSPKAEESRLYAGKYASIEELEKAYKEAERKMHEKTQRESEADLGSLFETTPQYAPPVSYGYPGVPSAPNMNDLAFKVDLYTQVKRATDLSFKELEKEAVTYVKNSPSLLTLLRNGDTSVIDTAYEVIKARRSLQQVEEEKRMAAEKARKEVANIAATSPKSVDDRTATPPPPPPEPSVKEKFRKVEGNMYAENDALNAIMAGLEEKGSLKLRNSL